MLGFLIQFAISIQLYHNSTAWYIGALSMCESRVEIKGSLDPPQPLGNQIS